MQKDPPGFTDPSNAIESCRRVPIERAHDLTPEIFYARYLTGLGKPVIVTDEMNTWNARSKWNLDFFKSRYGSDTVLPSVWPGTKYTKLMKLEDYIRHVQSPNEGSPGIWIDPKTKFPLPEPPEDLSAPLYLYGWRAFDFHPELLDDISQNLKSVEDWLPLLPPALHKVMNETTGFYSRGILIGPPNSTSRLHQDFLHSHAYLAQIVGRKKCTLFSPEDSAALYDGDVDPDRPALDRFPLFRNATAFECVLEPGEMLVMPNLWWHHVVALENSITVNCNFFNRVNFTAYLSDLLQRLPALVAGIEKLPGAKKALGIDWTSRGFDFPNRAAS
jgi:Cupin-like domain